MRKEHYADIDPEYMLDEGGFGSRDLFSPGKLVFGISVAEKKILWLKLRAEGIAVMDRSRTIKTRTIGSFARSLGCSTSRFPVPRSACSIR